MKKFASWVLLICMLLSAFSMVSVSAEEKPVITIARISDALIDDLDTNLTTLHLEEKFGIDIQFMEISGADGTAKLSVLVNSGSELPDIINIGLDDALVTSFANKGVLVPLDEYLDNPEMMTNFYNSYYEYPEGWVDTLMKQITMADGHRYSLPYVSCGVWSQSVVKMFINEGWLEALGLERPSTVEDFRDVLRAFVNDDPNGNGKADELGIVGAVNYPFNSIIAYILGSFVPNTYDEDYYYVEDGVVKAAFVEDRFRDGLEFAHSLVEEGLIYPASFTQDEKQAKAIITNTTDDYIVGMIPSRTDTGIASDYFFENFAMLEPMEGPDGMRSAVQTPPTAYGQWFITSACEDPELAFRIGEYGYNLDMQLSDRYGIKGVNWTDDPEIVKNYSSKMPGAGWDTAIAVLDDSAWSAGGNLNWRLGLPFTSSDAYIAKLGTVAKKSDDELTPKQYFDTYYFTMAKAAYGDYAYHDKVGKLVYTEDELIALADITASINTYRDENMTRFVTGSRDLSEWDAFVDEIYAMQLETQLEYMQRAYDRANG